MKFKMNRKKAGLRILLYWAIWSIAPVQRLFAMTPDEMQCVNRAFAANTDPSDCLRLGSTKDGGGSAGSGGSGSGSGSGGSGGGGGGGSSGGSSPPKQCKAPSWWFTGPMLPDEYDVKSGFYGDDDIHYSTDQTFYQWINGKRYKFYMAWENAAAPFSKAPSDPAGAISVQWYLYDMSTVNKSGSNPLVNYSECTGYLP